MSDNVSEVSIDLNDSAVVNRVLEDEVLRKLPFGSEEFKAAAAERFAKTDGSTEESAAEVTEQDDESSEADEAEEKEESKQPKQKSKAGVEKRINELVKEREALKKELEIAKQRQAVEARVEAVAEESNFSKAKPNFGDFDNIAEYQEALVDWKLEKKEHDQAVAQEQKALRERHSSFEKTWVDRENEFKGTVDDYDEYINVDSLKSSNAAREALSFLAESEHGPATLYALLSDSDIAAKFAAASPLRQVAILSKLEAGFEADEPSGVTKKTAVTKAPSPPKSLPKGKAVATSKSIYDQGLSFAEYNRLMDERERAKTRK